VYENNAVSFGAIERGLTATIKRPIILWRGVQNPPKADAPLAQINCKMCACPPCFIFWRKRHCSAVRNVPPFVPFLRIPLKRNPKNGTFRSCGIQKKRNRKAAFFAVMRWMPLVDFLS